MNLNQSISLLSPFPLQLKQCQILQYIRNYTFSPRKCLAKQMTWAVLVISISFPQKFQIGEHSLVSKKARCHSLSDSCQKFLMFFSFRFVIHSPNIPSFFIDFCLQGHISISFSCMFKIMNKTRFFCARLSTTNLIFPKLF